MWAPDVFQQPQGWGRGQQSSDCDQGWGGGRPIGGGRFGVASHAHHCGSAVCIIVSTRVHDLRGGHIFAWERSENEGSSASIIGEGRCDQFEAGLAWIGHTGEVP